MSKSFSIYLAGKIQKAHENPNETYWTEKDQEVLRQALLPRQLHFLNPAIRTDDLSDQRSVFGRDMMQVFSSDCVIVDARDRRGLGVGAEMMWAKMNGIPLISLAPHNTHYHKASTSLLGVEVNEWVHPFVEGLSDVVVESLEEAAQWILDRLESGLASTKGVDWIHGAMKYYLDQQFPTDQPMQDLAGANAELEKRFARVAAFDA
ncbi:MAG: hypothetical protein S4CHLAM102_13480 [Chlamydiia bacterium]|nr:hypothetical protein [Chlamydiia bacterium]